MYQFRLWGTDSYIVVFVYVNLISHKILKFSTSKG